MLPNAALQINISSNTRQEIINQVMGIAKEQNVEKEVFDQARAQIGQLLNDGPVIRFLKNNPKIGAVQALRAVAEAWE